MANLFVAYILWFFLGIFGVHHFYLKRDRQAFVWWSTLGGLFGLGWVRDFFRLREYVQEANEDEGGYYNSDENEEDSAGYINNNYNEAAFNAGPGRTGKPRVGAARFFGMMAMGYILGYVVMFAFPQDVFKYGNKTFVSAFFFVVPPTAVALGVHLVASIGRVKASFQWSVLGSAVGIIWQQVDDPTNIGGSSLFSALAVYYFGVSWKPYRRPRKGKCKRLSILFACGTVYLLLWGSSLYYNATVTTSDGEEVPLRVAINNFFSSPAWKETKETLHTIWLHMKAKGWRNIFEEIIKTVDPEGETNAYKVLGLSNSASQEEIKKQYKKLAKEWHPDKQKDPAKKKEAEERFMEIQKAYETLSGIQHHRAMKNKKSSARNEF